jgi:putative MATE family efflux protein
MTEVQLEEEGITDNSVQEAPLVQGTLWAAIWKMSWPMVLTTVSSSIVGLCDVQVAKVLGYSAQAAVGIAEMIVFVYMVFFMCMAIGTTAMTSRFIGERNHKSAHEVIGQALLTVMVVGAVLMVVSLIVSPTVMKLFSPSKEVAANAANYLSIYSLFLIPFGINCVISAAFRGAGDAKTPLLVVLSATTVTITLDFATVYGNWPVPGLGIRGIAIAGFVGSLTGTMVGFNRLSRSPLSPSLRLLLPLNFNYLERLLKISLPSGLQRLGWVLSTYALFFIFRHCENATAAIASWTIGLRVEALTFMPMMALSLAVSSIVGQNLGAKQYDRAVKAGWHLASIGIGIMLVLGTLMFTFASAIAQQMTTDPDTRSYVESYLHICSFSQPTLAVGMILSGALQGAADTRSPMWITLFAQWIFRLPMAWFLVVQMRYGPSGAWIAMTASMYLIAILTAWRYYSKAWLNIKI